jgi:hypothetical protein
MRVTPREVQNRRLTQEQRAVLTGTLLGDGCLAKHGRFHRLHIKHKAAHAALAEFKYRVFREFISMEPHRFDQRLGAGRYPCVQFATRTDPVFTEWHSRFYQERVKQVPDDIGCDLSPLALAVWLMDDGAADHAGVPFQTHGFGLEGSNRLAAVLREELGLESTLRRNRDSWIVYVGASSLSRLRRLIDPHLLPEFEYKLVPRRSVTP